MSKIQVFFEDIQPIKINKNHINKWVKSLIGKELYDIGDISVILCSDKYLLDINQDFLNHDYYTDIITFNYVEGSVISGDLFISVDRINENAKIFTSIFIKELYRVIFHGVLHLIGYNDKTDDEKKIIREKEDFYLSEVDFKGLEV